jgi:hypothetical protein
LSLIAGLSRARLQLSLEVSDLFLGMFIFEVKINGADQKYLAQNKYGYKNPFPALMDPHVG